MVKAIDIKKHKINQKFLSLCQTFDAGEGPPVFHAQRGKHTGIRDIFSCLIKSAS